MRGFEEFEAAELDEGDAPAGEFQLQRGAVVRGAEQHGLALERHALLAPGQDLLGHPAGLGGIVFHRHQAGLGGGGLVGPQRLGKALGRQRHHRVGGVQDGLGGAVVALQRQHPGRRREVGREVQHVAHLGGAKAVDGLRVVAHHGHALTRGLERVQDAGLQAVGVLVLVDQHMVEAGRLRRGQRGLLQHQVPGQQQVVVVERLLVLLGRGIGLEQALELVLPLGAPGKGLGQHGRQRGLAVDAARVDGQAGALHRKAPLGGREALLLAHQGHQVLGVAAVQDAELRRQAQGLGRFAQQPRTHAVEGAGPGQGGRGLRALEAQGAVQQVAGAALHPARPAARR
jgi:hypothetical protein